MNQPHTHTIGSSFTQAMTKTITQALAHRHIIAASVLLLGLLIAEPSFAGTGGTEFNSVWTTLKGWAQGTLGRIIAGGIILVGLVAGIARQSLMAFALGIGGAMGLYNMPTIVETIMSATV